MLPYSDEQIIQAIKEGGPELERAMRYLYSQNSCREQVVRFVFSRKGTMEDAEDIFQDGIRNLILSVRAGKYKGTGSVEGYLFGTCKNLWFKRFQKISREVGFINSQEEREIYEDDPEIVLVEKELEQKIDELLDQLGAKCRLVLELWKLSYSMKEIAGELGYKSEGVARKKKRLCLKKLLDILDRNPEWIDMLKPR